MTVTRCPICGASHAMCGPQSGSVPIDQRVEEAAMAGSLVRVETRPGYLVKMTREQAETYIKANPGARIVGEPDAKAAPEAEAEPADDAEAKQVEGPAENKQRTQRSTKKRGD